MPQRAEPTRFENDGETRVESRLTFGGVGRVLRIALVVRVLH